MKQLMTRRGVIPHGPHRMAAKSLPDPTHAMLPNSPNYDPELHRKVDEALTSEWQTLLKEMTWVEKVQRHQEVREHLLALQEQVIDDHHREKAVEQDTEH
jgi:hypothetical protein